MKPHSTWYLAAWRTAAVAGVFSALVIMLLLANGRRSPRVPALTTDGPVATLKTRLQANPEDAALTARLRRADLQLRTAFFRHRDVAADGALLLLGSLVVFLLSAKLVRRLRAQPAVPREAMPDTRAAAGRGIYAVTLTGLALGGILAGLAFAGRGDVSSQYVAHAAPPPAKAAYPSAAEIAKQWPLFRGPGGNGVAKGAVPSTWNGAKGTNTLWKVKVPLPGESSPVVWGNNVFLTGADEHVREVYCFDAATGKLRWKKPVTDLSCADKSPLQVMEDTGYAASTMATDGTRACAMFANGDLACFDMSGKRLWAKNMGRPDNMYGHATSLVIHKNRLILQFDQGMSAEDGKSALIALDIATGKQVWKTKRPVPNSWATPILINTGKREELITSANPWVIAYAPDTGKELWRAECLSGDVAPSPIFAGGRIFAVNTGANLAAIRPGGSGNVTKSHVAWTYYDDLPDIVSPVSNGELVLIVNTYGTLTCVDAKTGKKVWSEMVDNQFCSSPTLVGDKIYLMDVKGVTHILSAGRTYKVLGKTTLGEPANSTPAFVNGRIFIRGKHNLYCIGAKK